MEKENNQKNSDELRPLDPQKYTGKRFLRKYDEKEVTKPKKEDAYKGFPEKIKDFIVTYKLFIIIGLAILIILFFVLAVKKNVPNLNFIDEATGEYIPGYVYLDGQNLGSTTGKKFKDLPKDYCDNTHSLRLESGEKAFEWQTYPIDCKARNINFYISHEKTPEPQYIIFKFIDKAGNLVPGKLYFDGVFVSDIAGDISITREKCYDTTKIKFDYANNLSAGKDNNKALCNSTDVVEFRVS